MKSFISYISVRQQQIKNSSGMGTSFRSTIPSLTQHGGGHGHGGHGGYGGGHSGGHGHLDVFGIAHRGNVKYIFLAHLSL